MKKELLSLALALAMCLALFPAPAAALSDGTFEYTISDDGATITALEDKSIENLVIPDTIAGKAVVDVTGLTKCPSLKSVVFPSSVKSIGGGVGFFDGSSNVMSVALPDGLEFLGYRIFRGTKVSSVIVPDSVTEMGTEVFANCKNLTSVKLSSSLKEIPERCFVGSNNLLEIEIPDSVTTIRSDAFRDTGIISLTIPDGVKAITYQMCADCTNLKEVNLPLGIQEIRGSAFWGCSSLESILLPTTLKEIGSNAFKHTSLEEIILPYGLTEVSEHAFSGCGNLTAIYAPSTVKSIANVPQGAIVYCTPDSNLKAYCQKRNISCLSDASCDTRINVLYNGKRVSFGAYGQNPEIVNSRTMVPLRSIFEAMGADVQWDAVTKTVTAARGSNKIVMTLGQAGYQVNGVSKTMDTPPMLLNSRTMVPVRVVAESFGADVTWHAASATVLIAE